MPPVFSAVRRSPSLVVGALVGVAVGFASAGAFGALDAGLIGWCAGALAYMIVSAFTLSEFDAQAVRAPDAAADEGRVAVLWVSLAAAILALVAVLVDLADAEVSLSKTGDVVIALLAIVVTWFFIQIAFAHHYAHELSMDRIRLAFAGSEKPGFWDLMYVALMIGITYQSSDVATSSGALRKLLIAHSLMSFVFNTVILALVINLAAALAG
jgi:uncharacterized membrane protein